MKQLINKRFDFGDFEITVREILASISIVAVMLLIGFVISGNIKQGEADYNERFLKAIKIEGRDLFQYGMDTNIGDAFVYGDLDAVDTVTYPEIEGEYMYAEMVTERYTKHTRQVAHTRTVNGKTQTYDTTETYWTWDVIERDSKKCNEVAFSGVVFPASKISIPGDHYISTVSAGWHLRHVYYGVDTHFTGTIFTNLRDGTISDNTKFYNDTTIDEAVKRSLHGGGIFLFWALWIILIGGIVFVFYYADNKWLD